MIRFMFTWCLAGLIATTAFGADLGGRIMDRQGRPLAGATVLVDTAAPRVGVSVFCPSCYADCGKTTTTDADGRFMFRELDSTLLFSLVAAAEGHRARVTDKLDPAQDKPELALEAVPADLRPQRVVRGRVVDGAGKPVIGARVIPYGCRMENRRWWGSLPGVDSMSITNHDGAFIITCQEPAEGFDLEVRSSRHAPKRFGLRSTGETMHELAVEAGAMVRGRVLKDGKPVAGVSVGLVQTDRSSDTFLGDEEIGTDENGRFTFSFVAPNNDFYVYTKMIAMDGMGALPLRRVPVGESESLAELGDLELGAAHTLSGRIVLTDGASLPRPIQLLISREGAWDSQTVMVGGDGKFRFENVPAMEPITFTARVPGYQLAQDRNRFQQVQDWSIALFVDGDRDDIEIFYSPDVRDAN